MKSVAGTLCRVLGVGLLCWGAAPQPAGADGDVWTGSIDGFTRISGAIIVSSTGAVSGGPTQSIQLTLAPETPGATLIKEWATGQSPMPQLVFLICHYLPLVADPGQESVNVITEVFKVIIGKNPESDPVMLALEAALCGLPVGAEVFSVYPADMPTDEGNGVTSRKIYWGGDREGDAIVYTANPTIARELAVASLVEPLRLIGLMDEEGIEAVPGRAGLHYRILLMATDQDIAQ